MQVREKLLFVLSDVTDQTVLPILSALQAYCSLAVTKQQAHYRMYHSDPKLEVDVQITYHILCYDPTFNFIFEMCMPEGTLVSSSIEAFRKHYGTYDCIFEMSETLARKIVGSTRRHLVDGFAISIGSEASSLPDVSKLCPEYSYAYDILLCPKVPSEVVALLPVNKTLRHILHRPSLQERIRNVFFARAVIGETSFETYLASALHRPVLEFNTDPHLHKWTNPKYVSIVVPTSDAIQKGVRICLSHLDSDASIQTVQETSSVVVATSSSAQ